MTEKIYKKILTNCAGCPAFRYQRDGKRIIGSACYFTRRIITPYRNWDQDRIEFIGFPDFCPLEDNERIEEK